MSNTSENSVYRAVDAVATGGDVDGARLGRTLRPRHITMIAIGGIIGAGLFVGSSTSIATAGPAVIVSYGVAGLVILMVMRMLSEMAVALPGLQSFPDFARAGIGNWAGFLSGWLYWYFWVVVIPIEAIAGATIIHAWLPLEVWLLGVLLMAALTAVNLMSARAYGEFEFWFSSLKVGAIIAFIVVAASYVFGLTSPNGPTFANLTEHGGFAPFGILPVLAATTSVIFAFVGAEIATIAAAESPEPARAVARMTSTVAVRILGFYILSIGLIVAAVPWTTIVPGHSPFASSLEAMNIPGAATIMSIVVLIAVLSCLNSALYITSRVLFMLAAKGDAPQALVTVNKRKVPVRAIIAASLFSYGALAASVFSPQVVFSFLVNASGSIMLLVYLMIAVSQIRLRRRIEKSDPEKLALKMWFFPWLTYASIAVIVVILAAMALTPDLASQFYSSAGISIALVIIYWAARRDRAKL